jgi:hypothetical protein
MSSKSSQNNNKAGRAGIKSNGNLRHHDHGIISAGTYAKLEAPHSQQIN